MAGHRERDTIRIVLLDDHRLFAHGVARFLAELGPVTLHHEISEGLAALAEAPADLLVLDYYIPGQNAPETIAAVLREGHATRVVVISASLSPGDRAASLGAGALAFATKHMPPETLLSLCRDALADRLAPSDGVPLLDSGAETAARGFGLTVRQFDVLVLLGHGYSNREIADLLSIRPETVKTHLKAVFDRLGASSRTEAIALARDRGLL